MGWGSWLKDRLSDVADEAWDVVTDVADAAVDAVGEVAAATGDVVGTVGAVADAATFGIASEVLHVVDNTILDVVDAATGGLVNIDYDDGNVSGSVGVDGVLHVGAAIGEDGIRHSATALNQGFDVGLTEDGLNASGQAGIDWGPLPYAGGDLTVDADGDVTFDGRAQGTIPTPIGLLSGEAEAEFVREGEHWGGRLNADGTLTLPSGSVIGGGVDAAYLETADGSTLSLGLEGSFTVPGTGTVGGSVGYERLETDGMVAERFEAGAYAEGYGGRVDVGGSHSSVTTPDGSYSEWEAHGSVSVPGLGDIVGDTGGSSAPAAPEMGAPPAAVHSPAPAAISGPTSIPDVATPEYAPEPVAAPMPAPEPVAAPAPPAEFDSAIAAADDVEASVDDMFADLG